MKLEKRDKKSDFVMVRSQEGGKFKKENKVLKSTIIRPKWSTNIIFLCVFPKEIKENIFSNIPKFFGRKDNNLFYICGAGVVYLLDK